jgi:hypothetical protein
VYLYDTASALTDIGVDYLLTLSLKNIIIIYTMAQRKNPQNKKKSKKGEESGQRQKKQTQRIIINLGEELAKRGGGGDGALIHSPAQYAVDYV